MQINTPNVPIGSSLQPPFSCSIAVSVETEHLNELHLGGRDPESKQALLQLQTEQFAVSDAQGCTASLAQIRCQHGLGAVPRPRAATEFSHIVIGCTCTETHRPLEIDVYITQCTHTVRCICQCLPSSGNLLQEPAFNSPVSKSPTT